jgi:hypothetical protein
MSGESENRYGIYRNQERQYTNEEWVRDPTAPGSVIEGLDFVNWRSDGTVGGAAIDIPPGTSNVTINGNYIGISTRNGPTT